MSRKVYFILDSFILDRPSARLDFTTTFKLDTFSHVFDLEKNTRQLTVLHVDFAASRLPCAADKQMFQMKSRASPAVKSTRVVTSGLLLLDTQVAQ